MKVMKKWKLAAASMLAACCIGTAAAGFALAGGGTAASVSAAEPSETVWVGAPAAPVDGVAVCNQSVVLLNTTDILQLPNSTGVFYMYYNDASDWCGFSFRNGKEANGYAWNMSGGATLEAFPWHSICFHGTNQDMILNDSRRINQANGGTFGGVNGIEGENFLNGMIPVEVHIGKGKAQNDPSYIKIGGVELKHQHDPSLSVTEAGTRADTGSCVELTSSMFTNGCYLAVHYNKGSKEPVQEYAVSDVGSILTTDANMNKKQTHQAGDFQQDLTATLSSAENVFAGEDYKVTAKVNGYDLPAEAVTVKKTDDNTASVTISKTVLNAIDKSHLKPSTYFTIHVENGDKDYGSAVVGTNIIFEEAPVYAEGSEEKTLTKKEPFTYTFTYSGSENPLESMTVTYVISTAPSELVKDIDFTVTKGENDQYTVTITQEGVDKIFNGHVAANITLTFGPHTFRSSAFIDGQVTEYGVRLREGIDYVGEPKIDGYYVNAKIHKMDTSILASRVFYEKPVDVTEPIFIEYGTLDVSVEWMLISLMSSPKISETFSNEIGPAQGNIVSFIMFGQGRSNMQGMTGTFKNGNTIEHAANTNMKNNIVEIKLGATNAADGYVKVNGQKVEGAELDRTQQDFPSGKAYIGFFFNNKVGPFDFTCNTHINAVAITSPQADSAYKMDLGKAKDFSVDLVNTSGNLKLEDESGKEIPSSQYSYADGKLTIKAEYFSSKSYVKDGQIFIWDNEKETGTAFKMEYTNSEMNNARIVYAVKGGTANAEFDLGLSGDATVSVTQRGEPVSEDNYTVEGGKFIVKAASIPAEVGAYEYLVNANGKLYPCYVYVDNFVNGYAAAAGTGASEKGYTLTDLTSVTEAKTYDLSKGFKAGIDFTAVGEYYERGVNEKATSVTFRFYDPVSGVTLVVTVYANFPDDQVSSSTQALFISFALYDAEGTKLPGGNDRPVAPTDGNNSALGVHAFEIAEKSGGLTITLAGRPYSISATNMGSFNMKACVMTVTTENSVSGSALKVTFGDVTPGGSTTPGGGSDNPGGGSDNPGGGSDNPGGGTTPGGNENGDGSSEEGGCGSVIFAGFGAAVAALVLAVGAAVLVIRRKENN